MNSSLDFLALRKLWWTAAWNSEANILKVLCKETHILRIYTSPYHPQGNSKTERFHRVLNNKFSRKTAKRIEMRDSYIPSILASYRSGSSEMNGYSPFYLLYTRDPRPVPGLETKVSPYAHCSLKVRWALSILHFKRARAAHDRNSLHTANSVRRFFEICQLRYRGLRSAE